MLSYAESAHKKCQPLYLKESNLTQELRTRPSITLESWPGPIRILGRRSDDKFLTLSGAATTERVLTIRAIDKEGLSLEDWEKHIKAHIHFASGGDDQLPHNG